jgi:threonine synthase
MPTVVVPSGNYGNLTAGMLARYMGLPLRGFVAASNANDVIPKFLLTEEYCPRASVQTVANAMDVGDPSNYERMMALCGGDVAALKGSVKGFSCSDDEILAAINEIYERYDYLSDPHSAVGYLASKHYGVDGFWLSTAHAAKFSEVTKAATMQDAPLPNELSSLLVKPCHFEPMEAKDDVLSDYLRKL